MGANVNATSDFRERLAGRHSEDALRNAIQRIRSGVRKCDLPSSISAFLDDMGRRDGRNSKPFGRYPDVAREAATGGASLRSVLLPLAVVEAEITGEFFGDRLPSLTECQHVETNANRDFDHAQLAVAERELTVAEIDAAVEAGAAQIAATKQEIARLESLRSKVAR